MAAKTLTGELRASCNGLLPIAPEIEQVIARLDDPLVRIAIGGRLKSGKSTLLNAILGQRLAPTDLSECTFISATFRYGVTNQVVLDRYDGGSLTISGRPGGGIPETLPLGREQIRHLTVLSPNRNLDRPYLLTDTPGRDSLSGLDDYAMTSIAAADALLLVMPMPGLGDEEALEEYTARVAGSTLSAANVIGVLSRIDQLDGDPATPDVASVATRLARRALSRLSPMVADVVPVFGLLAQCARAQELRDDHVRALRLIDADRDGDRAADMLYSQEHFIDYASTVVDQVMCRELLALLDIHGLQLAFDAVRAGVTDAGELSRRLEQASGIGQLLDAIDWRFLRQSDSLRVASSLARLASIADSTPQPAARSALLGLVQSWLKRPELALGALAAAAQAVQSGVLVVADADAEQIRQLASGVTSSERLGLPADASPACIADEAQRRALRWRAREADSPRRAQPHILTIRLFYEHLHRRASAALDTPGPGR